MKYLKRIISLISVLAIFSCFVVPASAVDVKLDAVGLFDWAADYGRKIDHGVAAWFDKSKCGNPSSPNGEHNFLAQRTTVNGKLGLYYICEYCGKSAGEVMNGSTSEDGTATPGAYQQYVSSLPSNGYSSDGSILWYPSWDDLGVEEQVQDSDGNLIKKTRFPGWASSYTGGIVSFPLNASSFVWLNYTYTVGADERSINVLWYSDGYVGLGYPGFGPTKFIAPLSGTYFRMESPGYVCFYSPQNIGGIARVGKNWPAVTSGSHALAGSSFSVSAGVNIPAVNQQCSYVSGTMYFPVFRVVPDVTVDSPAIDTTTVYNTSTRMGNIGGNYGTINSDNSVTQYTTQYIVNETENTYTNPATGQTQTVTDWTYNYDDRSYDLTLDNGQTSTVTYGDDHVTINEHTVNDAGDTVTNNYTIYYVVNSGSGDADPSPSPSPSDGWHDGGSSGGGGAGRDPSPSPSADPSVDPSSVPSASPSSSPSSSPSPAPSSSPGGGTTTDPFPGPGDDVTTALSRVFKTDYAKITQPYGTDGHGGTDCIPLNGGSQTVTAHSEGDVVWTQTDQVNNQGSTGNASYGNAVKIKHANGYYTLYAHLDNVTVSNGSHVYKGQGLGKMGNTGNSYGAHLHFEVRDASDERINSDPYINADLPGLDGGGKSESDRSIWEMIGDLIGTGVNGILGLVEAVVSKVLDGLISLLEMLMERLQTVVETILSVFDALPALFGGFLDLLGVLFPFLPPEITTLLTFGIIAVVAIWIIKAFKGR